MWLDQSYLHSARQTAMEFPDEFPLRTVYNVKKEYDDDPVVDKSSRQKDKV